ncbi:3-dehydroquinate synthase [Kingella negevensis]|uniref:3-dehydroquinate synthase n=1 Tax=Kingella negevensis TaxID=1522312 RepID=UPI00050A1A39|nr:3-dehydroquinate synthase [Kingella negevensis]MDK4688354.1 3-dehydroquinate synthase [Kingella negevensis]WII91972.1 3-dehydroquinate synthase [Kingella negevensis]
MRQLIVDTPSHAYPIHIGNGVLNNFSLLQPHISKKVAIVSNTTVAPLYIESLHTVLKNNQIEYFDIILQDGEQYKNHESLNQIYNSLLQNHADRKTTIIALGGGVIGDMAGFAAATYQRGIPFVQIPTTLLSQVDSSVGGKTAINHPLGKNMIGAFYQPQLVLADLDTLDTLPERELSSGMAEVIKYAILDDAEFLTWLENNMAALMQRDKATLTQAVYHCCQMKANIVAQDETEQDIRALLNLGHTFGHAIETEMGYGIWLHGEAVAAGTVLACQLSEQLGSLKTTDTERIKAILRQAKLPDTPPVFPFERWLAHMRHDKKVASGKMRFITLAALGKAQLTTIEDEQILKTVLSNYLPK